jgi:hypothetical protein
VPILQLQSTHHALHGPRRNTICQNARCLAESRTSPLYAHIEWRGCQGEPVFEVSHHSRWRGVSRRARVGSRSSRPVVAYVKPSVCAYRIPLLLAFLTVCPCLPAPPIPPLAIRSLGSTWRACLRALLMVLKKLYVLILCHLGDSDVVAHPRSLTKIAKLGSSGNK